MGFMLIQNEQRVLWDVALAAMISLGRAFGFDPDQTARAVKVDWIQHDGKWMMGVDIKEPVPGMADEEVKAVIVQVVGRARVIAATNRVDNARTRFHG